MKILLVHPPYMRKPKEVPLGIAYIASFLRQCGHNVGVLDIDAYGYSRREVEEIIIESDYDCFGVGGLSSRYSYVKWLASVMKAHHPSRLIIGGNMVATANPEALLKNTDIDIAVIGEGEMSCKELLEARLGLRDFDSIKGIAFKRNREVFFNPPRERIADLDSLPFPAWDLFAIKTYLRKPVFCEHGLRSMNIVATRGCPFECVYCSRAFGRRVTRRSATNIIAEIKELKKRFDVQYIAIVDDLFINNHEYVYEFCDRMISERLPVKWGTVARVDSVDYQLLRRMRKAGCDLLTFGFESGNQTILDNMKKGVRVSQAEEAVRLTRRAGIRVRGSFMFGMVGENNQTIEETVDFIKRNNLTNQRLFFTTPYPGTALYEAVRGEGLIEQDEDAFLKRLGEMSDNLVVNLTEFSDEELKAIKRNTEKRLKNEVGLRVKLRRWIDVWQLRFADIKMSLYFDGLLKTPGMLLSKILNRRQ